MSKTDYAQELSVAKAIAQKVGLYQLQQQDSLGKINLKEDRSPFTHIDTTSEEMIKEALLSAFVQDSFWGEESGKTAGSNNRQWIVDPLDGTRPYIHKIPTFSILIALEEEGELVVAVCHFPALNETYYATKNGGAFCNDRPISVSKTSEITDAMGSSLGLTETGGEQVSRELFSEMQRWDYVYGFMDAYSYMSVASGKLDLCITLIDFPWDRAPAALIVQEAGGVFSDLQGEKSIYGDQFIVSNGHLHTATLGSFKK